MRDADKCFQGKCCDSKDNCCWQRPDWMIFIQGDFSRVHLAGADKGLNWMIIGQGAFQRVLLTGHFSLQMKYEGWDICHYERWTLCGSQRRDRDVVGATGPLDVVVVVVDGSLVHRLQHLLVEVLHQGDSRFWDFFWTEVDWAVVVVGCLHIVQENPLDPITPKITPGPSLQRGNRNYISCMFLHLCNFNK